MTLLKEGISERDRVVVLDEHRIDEYGAKRALKLAGINIELTPENEDSIYTTVRDRISAVFAKQFSQPERYYAQRQSRNMTVLFDNVTNSPIAGLTTFSNAGKEGDLKTSDGIIEKIAGNIIKMELTEAFGRNPLLEVYKKKVFGGWKKIGGIGGGNVRVI